MRQINTMLAGVLVVGFVNNLIEAGGGRFLIADARAVAVLFVGRLRDITLNCLRRHRDCASRSLMITPQRKNPAQILRLGRGL